MEYLPILKRYLYRYQTFSSSKKRYETISRQRVRSFRSLQRHFVIYQHGQHEMTLYATRDDLLRHLNSALHHPESRQHTPQYLPSIVSSILMSRVRPQAYINNFFVSPSIAGGRNIYTSRTWVFGYIIFDYIGLHVGQILILNHPI